MKAAIVEMPQLLTEADLIDYIPGMTARSARELRARGDGPPFVKVTRTAIVYRADSLLEWLRKREQTRT